MATSSLASGYLTPSLEPVNDDLLHDILHGAIVGITGINGKLVRPRWTPEPLPVPDFKKDWAAFGITRSQWDTFSFDEEAADGLSMDVARDEILYCLHSFYGPNAAAMCARFRAGMSLSQNRAVLLTHNIALVSVEEATRLPALLKEKWVNRVDADVVYRRRTTHAYSVLTIQSAQLGLDNEQYVTPITAP